MWSSKLELLSGSLDRTIGAVGEPEDPCDARIGRRARDVRHARHHVQAPVGSIDEPQRGCVGLLAVVHVVRAGTRLEDRRRACRIDRIVVRLEAAHALHALPEAGSHAAVLQSLLGGPLYDPSVGARCEHLLRLEDDRPLRLRGFLPRERGGDGWCRTRRLRRERRLRC